MPKYCSNQLSYTILEFEMDTSFLVAHFHDDESVEAVPSSWFKDNNLCDWPKNKALVGKFIVSKLIPNDKKFKYLRVRVLLKNIGKHNKYLKLIDRNLYSKYLIY